MNKISYWLIACVLLAMPGFFYAATQMQHGGLIMPYFWPNYFYMAAPHFLALLLSIWPKAQGNSTLLMLLILNILLLAFRNWIQNGVPARESGLAWIMYIPFSAINLFIYILLVAKRKEKTEGGTIKASHEAKT